MEELQDLELVQEALNYRTCLEIEWIEAQRLFNKYPDIFPKEKISKELFMFAYANVVTRCFGWDKVCTMIIPVADAMNHASMDIINEVVDLDLHNKATKGMIVSSVKKYATKSRMSLDYSDLTKKRVERQMSVKNIFIGDEIAAVCLDTKALDLDKIKLNIWNVYESK